MPKHKGWRKSLAKTLYHCQEGRNRTTFTASEGEKLAGGPPGVNQRVTAPRTPVSAVEGIDPMDVGIIQTSVNPAHHRVTAGTTVSTGLGVIPPVTVDLGCIVTKSTNQIESVSSDARKFCKNESAKIFADKFTNEFASSFNTSFPCDTTPDFSTEARNQSSAIADNTVANEMCVYCQHINKSFKHTVFASFSQSDLRFPTISRDRQCTCNSLMFLVHFRSENKMTPTSLDDILIQGDLLYNKVIKELKSNLQFKSHLLQFEDLPSIVEIDSSQYSIFKDDPIWGTITDAPNFPSAVSLEFGIKSLLEKTNMGLLIAGAICSAIVRYQNTYFFFDSHSHGLDTMPSQLGKAVLNVFHNYDDLLLYLYAFYENIGIVSDIQFELLPISIAQIGNNNVDYTSSMYKEINNYSPSVDLSSYFDFQERMQAVYKQKKSSLVHSKPVCTVSRLTEVQKRKSERILHRKQNKDTKKRKKQEYMKQYMRLRRENIECRTTDRICNANYMKKVRKNPPYKEFDKLCTARSMKKLREKKEYREAEKICNAACMRNARENPEFRKADRKRNAESMKKTRENPTYKKAEKVRNAMYMQNAREDPNYKEADRARNAQCMRKSRKNPEFLKNDRKQSALSMKKSREKPDFKTLDRTRTLKSMQKARNCSYYRAQERIRSLKSKRKSRESISQKAKERKANKFSMHKYRKSYRFRERKESTISDCIKSFQNAMKHGFAFICTCCHQTWSDISVTCLKNSKLNYNSEVVKKCLTGYTSVDGKEWICRTCLTALKENRIPKISVANLFSFPKKPEELHLHQLEERLVSLRIPFMQIRELPRGRQLSVKGNVVNCPVDVQPTVCALPRQLDDSITIPVKLKRRKMFKNSVFVENIRPNIVMKALKWLLENSDLYKYSGITVDRTWTQSINNTQGDMNEFLENLDTGTKNEKCNIEHLHDQPDANYNMQPSVSTEKVQEDGYMSDNFSEIDDSERIIGNSDTLLDSNVNGTDHVYTFAPGEGQTPLSLYKDPDAEYLSFPTIYCGQRRPNNDERLVKNVHYSDIAKWELRSADRRVANNVPNIFFKLKILQMKQILDKVNLAIRRFKTKGKNITAGQLLDNSTVHNLVNLDEGYYILRTLRNSPAYLAKRKKDVFAMIRQLGLPTWFVSLSAADTRWKELLKILAELNYGQSYSDTEIENMSWDEITSLIQKDPVTCSRNFNHRIQQFINIVLKSSHNPIGEITDYFYRTEFQHRGSPHIHMLIWIKDAPKYNESPTEDVVNFIDKYASCSKDLPENLGDLVKLQFHRHSKTCRKKGKAVCRFDFPLPPMSSTQILEPLLQEETDEYKKKYEIVQKKMNNIKDEESISFDEFLSNIAEMSEDEYIKCVRSTLTTPKVFLKRQCAEVRINPYMKVVLPAWNANHDIQFVLDPYACATYIVSYISKSEKGMSILLDQACKEARQGHDDIRKQVRHIGNKFLNAVETSAQEAVYLTLQLPLTYSTREVLFLNTSLPDERTHLLKSRESLEQLPANSTNIEADNIIKRYAIRPRQLENWCLADYAAMLQVTFPKDLQRDEIDWDENDDAIQINPDEQNTSGIMIRLKNGIIIRQRQKSRVLRYVRYSVKTDSENYYREKLLLFMPWRNELSDLLDGFSSYENHYHFKSGVIHTNLKKYEHYGDHLDVIEKLAHEDLQDYNLVAPQAQQAAEEEIEEGSVPSETYVPFDPKRPLEKQYYDFGADLGLAVSSAEEVSNPCRMPNDEYYSLVRSLNCKQTEFFIHVMHWIKTKDDALYTFLSGGAGVGKSVLIRALYQALHRHLCSVEGENPENVRILLCAPTGKAAYNIGGATIHSAFRIPASQGFTYKPLDSETLNSLRVKYRSLSLVMIDEVSMVGNGMLNFISERLKQIRNSNRPFGNVSVVLIGDLFQLKPVFDRWIFANLTAQYGALASNLWKDHFHMFELTKVMRQKDDSDFAQLLNRLREGQHTREDITSLSSRIVDRQHLCHNYSASHLYTTRDKAHTWNSVVFDLCTKEKITVKSVDDVKSQDSSAIKAQILLKIPKDSTKTLGLLSSLPLGIDLRYDLTSNLDTSDGLTNGASCLLRSIDFRSGNRTTRPSILWVEFDNRGIGANWRKTYKHLYNNTIDRSWTPIFDINRTFSFCKKQIARIQFPLCSSAAKTIHKAQGSTLDQVYVDMSTDKTVPHIHYVALSRARTMAGLHIMQLQENKISVDTSVQNEMVRLRSQNFNLCYIPIYNLDSNSFTIAFNNVRSLNLHYKDINCSTNIRSADIVALSETRLMASDDDENFILDGFSLVRNDESITATHRPFHGTAAYVSNRFLSIMENVHKLHSNKSECLKLDFNFKKSKLQILVIYNSPNCTLTEFKTFINSQVTPVMDLNANIVVIGDFNFDILCSQNAQFLSYLESHFSVKQIVKQITTEYNSMLDLIFTNVPFLHTDVIECYWSDHKLVYVAFLKEEL